MRLLVAALLLACGSMIVQKAGAQEAWVARGTADLVLLDKIKGIPSSVPVKAGESVVFGSLTVRVRSCFVRPPDQAADATAFVDVTNTRGNADVFHGWVLASAPAVSQMEHPVYDLKLMGCH